MVGAGLDEAVVTLPPTSLRGERAHPPRLRLALKTDAVYWRRRALVLALCIGVAVPIFFGARSLGRASAGARFTVDGVSDGMSVGREGLARFTVRLRVDPSSRSRGTTLKLDGRTVPTRLERGTLVWRPGALAEGRHRLVASAPRGRFFPPSRKALAFTVDTRPPALAVRASSPRVRFDQPVTFQGSVEPGAVLTADGRPVPAPRGRFQLHYRTPPTAPVVLVARDRAGNASLATATVAVDRPTFRAVHVSAWGWATDRLREPVLAMADRGLIDAVQLDLKDESGIVGYQSALPRAREVGSARGIYDLPAAVAELHRRHLLVVGRLVVFRDPILARSAWADGHRDQVVQRPGGAAFAGYGGFTNLASPAVWDYNIDVAVEAARAGVDVILYDYVRRPEGPLRSMVFPGLRRSPEEEVVAFLARSRARLKGTGARQGASVFGISATRPDQVAQDLPQMAREVDYLAPMLYPSHWRGGEYGVADPQRSPYDIVMRSLRDVRAAAAPSSTAVVPWLQDFSLGVKFGPAEVRAQIEGAAAAGVNGWLLWDPGVTYTSAALSPIGR